MSVWTDEQFDPSSLIPPLSVPLVPPVHELEVVMEMLTSLPTLTQPGQRFTMFRIVEIIRHHLDVTRSERKRNPLALEDLVTLLEHECERQWPDVETFNNVAQSMLLLVKKGR